MRRTTLFSFVKFSVEDVVDDVDAEEGRARFDNAWRGGSMQAGGESWSIFTGGILGAVVGSLSALGARIWRQSSAASQQPPAVGLFQNSFAMAVGQNSRLDVRMLGFLNRTNLVSMMFYRFTAGHLRNPQEALEEKLKTNLAEPSVLSTLVAEPCGTLAKPCKRN